MDPAKLAGVGLRYAVDGAVATVTLDRRETRNAQTPAMWRVLAEIGAEVPDDVRVVVVRGEGHSFSAGLDRRMLSPGGDDGDDGDDGETLAQLVALGSAKFSERVDAFQQGFLWLRDPRFVSIAAIQGYAIGAGFQLALSCDLRVATDDAQLAMKETALGLVPDLTGTKPLVDCVGYARALEICVTGRMVGAREAAEIGLVTAVVSRSELRATIADLTVALLAAPVGAVRDTKALLQAAAGRSLEDQRRAERETQYDRLRQLAGG